MRKLNIAGTVINTWARRFLAKRYVEERRRENTLTLLADARAWKEGWSEEAEAWFYLNENTGEDLWEPPASGYTKVDGSLVMANGTIIEDPDKTPEWEAVNDAKALWTRSRSELSDEEYNNKLE